MRLRFDAEQRLKHCGICEVGMRLRVTLEVRSLFKAGEERVIRYWK
jgi:hypothetical protein